MVTKRPNYLLLLRVHPGFKNAGLSKILMTKRLKMLFGNADKSRHGVGLVMANLGAINMASLRAQFSSDVSTPLIWSAGFDVDVLPTPPPVLYIVHAHRDDVRYEDLAVTDRVPIRNVFGESGAFIGIAFQAFAQKLAQGHVALLNPQNKDELFLARRPANMRAYIPDIMRSVAALGFDALG